MRQGPGVQKILPEMHEMTLRKTQMASALPSDSEGESEEELEYPQRGATYEHWDLFHKQQIRMRRCKHYKNGKTTIESWRRN